MMPLHYNSPSSMDEGDQASDERYLCTSSGTMSTSTVRMLPLCRIIIGNLIVFPALAGSDPGLEALFGRHRMTARHPSRLLTRAGRSSRYSRGA
jgi:hypothetical protein